MTKKAGVTQLVPKPLIILFAMKVLTLMLFRRTGLCIYPNNLIILLM